MIPVFGEISKLRACLSSLEKARGNRLINVVVVDDKGPEPIEALDWKNFSAPWGLRVLRNPENRGFPYTANRGAAQIREPLVLLLNSDVTLEPGAIEVMADEFRDPQVGIVGPKLLFPLDSVDPARPAGRIQHAGMAINFEGRPVHTFSGWPADHKKVNQRQERQVVTGACLMVRRNLWKQAGGFDEVYRQGTFEDMELCIRIRMMQHQVIYQPKALGYHHVGASAGAAGVKFPINENWLVWKLRVGNFVFWDQWRFC